jgi:periplasmic protein TonB
MTSRALRLLLLLTLLGSATAPQTAVADDTIYTKVDENPVPITTPPPIYPESLIKEKLSGIAAVVIVIDQTGAVISSTVSKSSHPDLEKPAIDAVSKWKFQPGKKDGKPVKVKVTLPLRFNYTAPSAGAPPS